MGSSERSRVKQLVKKLGGQLVGVWSTDTSYLVMSSITVTIKVVCALAHCRPIVTPAWLEAAVKCASIHKTFPSASRYLPPVVDPNLGSTRVSFSPCYERKTVFNEKIFYFLSDKQHGDLHQCVAAAGGSCQLISAPRCITMEILSHDNAVVLAAPPLTDPPTTTVAWVSDIQQYLERNQLRFIQDCEIGFALLHKSTQTYCNPSYLNDLEEAAAVPLPPPTLSQMMDSYTEATPSSQLPPTSQPNSDITLVDVTGTQSNLSSSSMRGRGLSAEQSKRNVVKRKLISRKILSSTRDEDNFVAPQPLTKRSKTDSCEVKNSQPSSPGASNSSSSVVIKSKPALTLGLASTKNKRGGAAFAEDPSLDDPGMSIPESQGMSGSSNILAPSSLTPSNSGQTAAASKTTMKLPSRTMIASAFGGKRSKKRRASPPCDGDTAKRRCEEAEDHVTKAGQEPGSEVVGEGHVMADEGSHVIGLSEDVDVIVSSNDASKTSRDEELPRLELAKSNRRTSRKSQSVKKCSLYDEMPKLDTVEPDRKQSQINLSQDTGGSVKLPHCETGSIAESVVDENLEESEVRSKDAVINDRDRIPASIEIGGDSPRRTPVKTLEMPGSPFLSARRTKVKKSLLQESFNAPSDQGSGAPASVAQSSQVSSVRGVTPGAVATESFTSLSFNQGKEVLTAFSSRGHRSKATPSCLDSMWAEDDEVENGEGPLGGDEEEDGDAVLPSHCFEPVRDADGFIKARDTPKLKMSRGARLALHARSDFGLGLSGRDLCGPLLSQPVEVEVMELLVDRDRSHDRHMRHDSSIGNSRLRNFKKFRKTGAPGVSHAPHHSERGVCIDLMVYVPVVSQELPDWEMEVAGQDEEGSEGSVVRDDSGGGVRMSQGSQDFNVFSLHSRKTKKR